MQEHRRLKLSDLEARRRDLGLHGEIVCLDPDGNTTDPALGQAEDPVPVDEPDVRTKALTSLRRCMRTETPKRTIVGGKRHDFQGRLPGLMEEVLIAPGGPDPQPVHLAAGFGGVTADIVRALGSTISGGYHRTRMRRSRIRGWPTAASSSSASGWSGLNNGLTEDENRRLAATHRPSEIASLVSPPGIVRPAT